MFFHVYMYFLYFPGLMLGSSTTNVDGCRVAPYVNMPSMRLAFDRIHMQHLTHYDTTTSAAAAAAAVAAVTGVSPLAPPVSHAPVSLPSMLFYPTPHYAVNLALAQGNLAANKNSSIADLRLKAKKHAAALGL
jgi:short stature homeobox protein